VAGVGAAFVLELQTQAAAAHGLVVGILEQRRGAFAERDDMRRIGRIVDIECEQCAEAPHVAALRPVPRGVGPFAREPRQIQDHFHRTAVDRIEIHRHVGRILAARTDATQTTHERHEDSPATALPRTLATSAIARQGARTCR
jgi:hypothetical protein